MTKESNLEAELFRKTGSLVGEYLKTGPKGAELMLIHLCLRLSFQVGPDETMKHLRHASRYPISDLRRALFSWVWRKWRDRHGNNKAAFIRYIQQQNKALPAGQYIGPNKHASAESLRKYLAGSY
jgi:hypothetical protein